jgi:secreted trypsin-like serine protease
MKTSVLLFTLLLSACAPTESDEEPTESAIIGGTRTGAYPAVMLLFAGDLATGAGSLCTATVIAPRVLLTAAHCVAADEVGPDAEFAVFTGTDFDAKNGRLLTVSSVMHDPAFDARRLEAGHDVGAVILASAVGTRPIAVNRGTDPQTLIGQPVRLVGYGVNDGAHQTGSGVKRVTTTALHGVDAHLLAIGDGDHGTCQGDSGGPAFMSIGGVQTLVGVTSFGEVGCSRGGYDTRVDRYGAFIDAALARGR